MADAVKHGGCTDCGNKTDAVLTSILRRGNSIALCAACMAKPENAALAKN